MLTAIAFLLLFTWIVVFPFTFLILRLLIRRRKARLSHASQSPSIGFLHPHSLSGGGGERVLWCAIQATQTAYPNSIITIYSSWKDANTTANDALSHAKEVITSQFGLNVDNIRFHAIDISRAARLVDATNYPRFTLVLQAFGGATLGAIAFVRHPVDIFVDTANLNFALIAPKMLGARTVSYVHYPVVSSDMLRSVSRGAASFNNSADIARSRARTAAKIWYYRMFGRIYGISARFIDAAAANSSWTARHLRELWGVDVDVIFPPCELRDVGRTKREGGLMVSVGQFRPEKNHALQMELMRMLRARGMEGGRLVMVGGTRDRADERRAGELVKVAEKEGLAVEVRTNVDMRCLQDLVDRAEIGVHTMRDEHFGISVVELMAGGVIVVAHRSGGVASDIIHDGETGFLANGVDEYADCVQRILGMSEEERRAMRDRGLNTCDRFKQHAFKRAFVLLLSAVMAH